ncbi:hypothetical protein [Roseomonas rosulenta]|uniref:hypothetical protein n=1 Tax=Roseomonas rosulenta TaxID=2748667 RepID=UPI0018DF9A2D|nr:hypothetical protein [Roseomonas rosulenta]
MSETIGEEDAPGASVLAEEPLRKMLVGTFHKTGTMLMFKVFTQIAVRRGYRLSERRSRMPLDEWDIFFDAPSRFETGPLLPTARGIVVIRDPRDAVISGAHYHARLAPGPPEAWAHVPRPGFGGLTYAQKTTSLPDDEARISFEMDHMAAGTLKRMAEFAKPSPMFRTIHFEDLATDTELLTFRRMFLWLGLRRQDMAAALRIAEANSLFSGRLNTTHMRSGRPE